MDITFEYAKAIPGTVLSGTTGVVRVDGEIVADFIELEPGLFYADDACAGMTNEETWVNPWKEPENEREIMGSKAEVIEFFIGE